MSVEREELRPINHGDKNRLIDSFSDEECWQFLRFRKLDLHRLSNLPAIIQYPNGIVCPGEHAFCLLLYRIYYPSRLISLQDIFGRDYTQLSRIFKLIVDLIYMHHKHKVHGNLDWYADRFDTYHECSRIRDFPLSGLFSTPFTRASHPS
jgi:hypothetical protein